MKLLNIKKPQHNQSASSDIDQQDLTTGSSIDNDAATDAKIRISNDGAKHEFNNLIHKFRRATERTMKLFENIGIDVDVSLYKNSTKNQTLPITSRENADQSRIPSKATNAQQNAAPDTHVQNAILSTSIAKIQKDTEEAILLKKSIFLAQLNVLYRDEKYIGPPKILGLWIEDKQEFAKFVSAVNNNYVFGGRRRYYIYR